MRRGSPRGNAVEFEFEVGCAWEEEDDGWEEEPAVSNSHDREGSNSHGWAGLDNHDRAGSKDRDRALSKDYDRAESKARAAAAGSKDSPARGARTADALASSFLRVSLKHPAGPKTSAPLHPPCVQLSAGRVAQAGAASAAVGASAMSNAPAISNADATARRERAVSVRSSSSCEASLLSPLPFEPNSCVLSSSSESSEEEDHGSSFACLCA